MPTFHPLVVYAVILIGFVATNLILTHLIGPKKRTAVKQMPYESGMDPVGDARQPFNVRFCLVAILYLVFDVELLFLYPWAVSAFVDDGGARPQADGIPAAGIPTELRSTVFAIMLAFMATLVIAYVYAWRKGVFKWR
jgi:NADH-quinone oxidoreductase subunit A